MLITIDTLRADRVGAYGAVEARTPRLDAIAERGVRFEVAISPVPLTLPSHASLMTGLDPPAHGVRHNSVHRLSEEIPTLAEHMREAGFATAAFVAAAVLERRFGLDRGFDLYDDEFPRDRRSSGTGYAERRADAVVDAALAWLEQAPDRFFLWVHLYDPHQLYQPPPAFAMLFPSDPYAGEIAFVDAEIGRLLDAIRERWGSSGLGVVATSDHGESLGEHGEFTHSYLIYEATQRIPLMIEGPGVPAGRVVPGPASLVDLAPTILAWVGAAPLPGATGHDLRPLLDVAFLDSRPLYMETVAPQLDLGWSPLQGLRAGRFKYIRAPRPELYELLQDPGELADLSEAMPRRVRRLDTVLEDLIGERRRQPEPVVLPSDARRRLEALGYVVPATAGDALALGRVGGIDPKDHPAAFEELVKMQQAMSEQRYEDAREHLDRVEGAGPHVLALRAKISLEAGEYERAEREARRAVEARPERSEQRVMLAMALAAQGREREAGVVLTTIPGEGLEEEWMFDYAARAKYLEGDVDGATELASQGRARFPESADLLKLHGDLLEHQERLEEALEVREEALRRAPDNPRAQDDVARGLLRLDRDLDRAEELVRSALRLGGDAPELLGTLAALQLARGEYAEARATAQRGLGAARGPTREHLLSVRARAEAELEAAPGTDARSGATDSTEAG